MYVYVSSKLLNVHLICRFLDNMQSLSAQSIDCVGVSSFAIYINFMYVHDIIYEPYIKK